MASDEDYLDNLLSSINQKKSDVEKASVEEKRKNAERIAQENDIKPEDDFLKASGLDHYTEKPIERKNLKKAFSEEDFLKEFENELNDGSADKFVEEFDRELDAENNKNSSDEPSHSFDVTEGSRNISFADANAPADEIDEFSGLDDETTSAPDSSGDDFVYDDLPSEKNAKEDTEEQSSVLDNIDNIVKNAKNGDVGDDIHSLSDSDENVKNIENDIKDSEKSASKENTKENSTSDDASDFADIELPDDFDLNDTSAKEVPLMDENAENQDLDSLLDGSSEFSDLGDMLNADENSEELPESRDQFEQSAETVENNSDDPFADLQNDDASISDLEGNAEPKKGSFFSNLISKIKNIFSKSDDENPSDVDGFPDENPNDSGIVDIAPKNPSTDELIKEDQKILNELSDSPAAPEGSEEKEEPKKKEKKKKEKKKKENKPKPKKQPKPKKVKAPKPPDNSPKIPTAAIAINAILALSIVLLVVIVSNAVSHRNQLATAKEDYDAGNYHEAYVLFSGLKLKDTDEPYLRKSKIMSSLSIAYDEYKTCMDAEKYDMALDALVKGVHYYKVNKPVATELQIDDIYDAMEQEIASELSDKFGLSEEDAENIYSKKSRVLYTVSINDILKQNGYVNGETQ